jgi:hypothetical protein
MSVPVPIETLRRTVDERGPIAFLLTVSDDARAHAVQCPVVWEGVRLAVEVGRRSAANAAARPGVSLLYPARTPGDYSLIVDGTAAVEARGEKRAVLVTPTTAVLHRPAAAPDPTSSCGADCIPLLRPTRRGAD